MQAKRAAKRKRPAAASAKRARAGRERTPKKEDVVIAMLLGIILLLVGLTAFMDISGTLTGLATVTREVLASQEVSHEFTTNASYLWFPERAGPLKSLKISGAYERGSVARVYLETPSGNKLILDTSLNATTGNLLTANAVIDTGTSESASPEANATTGQKSITASLFYADGIAFDEDNDGIEGISGIIDIGISAQFTWDIDYGLLCTLWRADHFDDSSASLSCRGNGACCAFTGLASERDAWDDTLYLSYGSRSTGYQNGISAQLIYYNVTESSADVIAAQANTLSAIFEADTIPFIDSCIGTCRLEALGAEVYTLIVEVESGSLTIDSITYAIVEETENSPPRAINNLTYLRIQRDSQKAIELVRLFSDPDGDVLSYAASSSAELDITLNATHALLTPKPGFEGLAAFSLRASDGIDTASTGAVAVNVANITSAVTIEKKAPVRIGSPVRWLKRVTNAREATVNITLPRDAFNLTVRKLDGGIREEVRTIKVVEEAGAIANISLDEKSRDLAGNAVTGAVVGVHGPGKGIITRLIDWMFSSVSGGDSITGFATLKGSTQGSVLAGSWSFEEQGSIAFDDSGNDNLGIIEGTAIANGSRGYARNFSNDLDAIEFSNGRSLNLDAFTLTAWVRMDGSDKRQQVIAARQGDAFVLSVAKDTGTFRLEVRQDSAKKEKKANEKKTVALTSTIRPEAGRWYFIIAAVGDDAALFVYDEGFTLLDKVVAADAGPVAGNAGWLSIGGIEKKNKLTFGGGIVEVRLYQGILSVDNIRSIHAATGGKSNGTYEEAAKYVEEEADASPQDGNVTEEIIKETELPDEFSESDLVKLIIENPVDEVEVEFETPGPQAIEEEISDFRKLITISSDIHYTDVLAYASLPKEANAEAISLWWLINGSRKAMDFDAYDTNNNSKIDYIEWIVPHLSNQTFEITIRVLTLHSVAEVGKNWTVYFNASGTANLSITLLDDAMYHTTWGEWPVDDPETPDHLRFIELLGDSAAVTHQKRMDDEDAIAELFVEGWNYSEGILINEWLIEAKHAIRFQFGDEVAYAYNSPGVTISFVPPTPDSGSAQDEQFVVINASITASNLTRFIYSWNRTNITMYNSSLLLMYNFENLSALGEDNLHAVDVSGNSRNATLFNGANFTGNGRFNGALDLPGSDEYAQVALDGTSQEEFTVSLWFKADNTADNGEMWVWHPTSESGSAFAGINLVSGNLRYWADNANRVQVGIPSGVWIHAAMSLDSSDLWRFYINGTLNSSYQDDSTHSYQSTAKNITMGTGFWGYFDGKLDEVKMWNRSLSPSEIYYEYASALVKVDSDSWEFIINQTFNSTNLLDNGSYTYQAFASNATGSFAATEERSITIGTTPTPPPVLSFVNPTPANGSNTTNTSVLINVTVTESALGAFSFLWNGTNVTLYNDSLILMLNLNNNSAIGENDSVAVDVSNLGNNGTIIGATITEKGRYGQALNTSGGQSMLNITDTAALNASRITLSLWFRPDYDYSSSPAHTSLIRHDRYELYLKDGNITFRYDAFNLSVRPTAISAGVWYHAIATYNETNQSLYLNSVLQVTG